MVSVDVNIRGNVAETKNGERCFTSLNGWRIKADGVKKSAPLPTGDSAPEQNKSSLPENDSQNEDDLPF